MRAAFEDLPKFSDYVLVDGAFNPLHAGHVAHLESAASRGPLLCSVCSDDDIRAKGGIPFLPQEERLRVLEALHCIGVVYAKDRPTHEVLAQMRPKAYVKGCDWVGRIPEAQIDVCEHFGIPIKYTKTPKESSSDRLKAWALASADQSLDNLERAIAEQQAHQILPWEPVTDYSFEARKAIEGPHAELILKWLCQCEDADILDYGCGPGHLVRMLNEHPDCGMVVARGYDPNAPHGVPKVSRDVPDEAEYWDLVICREVLEHCRVTEIPEVVRTLFRLSAGLVYITTRHSASGIFDVGTEFDVDPTHITLLSQPFLRSLCVLNGGTRRRDLETKLDWQNKGRVLVYEISR